MEKNYNWQDWTLRLIGIVIIVITIILTIIFISISFIYFPPRGLNSNLDNLGKYGDYFGGFLSVILGFASLGVTLYLALLINELNAKQNQTAINAQKRIALMQIKLQELGLLKTHCDENIEALWRENVEDVEAAQKSIDRSLSRFTTLFPEMESKYEYFEFKLIKYSLIKVVDDVRSIKEAEGKADKDRIDDLINSFIGNIQDVEKHYLVLMKKLGNWAME